MTAVIAVMPYTPSALNVLRSAWIPAPPPESEPAIVSTRGRGGFTPSRLPSREVIPPGRRERPLGAVDVHRHQAFPRYDLADLGKRDAEGLAELLARARHRIGRHGGEELVVLAARERGR